MCIVVKGKPPTPPHPPTYHTFCFPLPASTGSLLFIGLNKAVSVFNNVASTSPMATLLQRSAPPRRESLCQEPRKEGNSRNTADYDSTQPGITTKTPERRGSWKAGSVGITEKIKQVCDEAVKADKTRVHGRALAEGRKQVRKSDGKCNESRNKQKKCVCEHCGK